MWVRAVATAVAVWCVSGAAMAAGYAEVWNPPEATGHAAKHAKKAAGATKVKPVAGAKTGLTHAASAQHGAQRAASASKSGVHGDVKKVASKNVGHGGALKGAGKPKSKTAVIAQGKKPHAKIAQAKPGKPGQGRVMRANLIQGHAAPTHAVKVTAKTGASASMSAPAKAVNGAPGPAAANVTASPAGSNTNPATASSGSLPPILH
ncbi:hypothetical protein ACT2FY_19885 [Paraburkholderia fungorum]|uniref:hypothetical protein n=1 Tax=Paraburkholderia fungorum TaxID=134537 RepID=UPI00402B438A